ncbi:MAG: phosphatidate cytidylyltransferase [Pseudomonadota bacterium]
MVDVNAANTDLPVRAASGIAMVAVTGAAWWLGGWVWTVFVGIVAMGVLWEWRNLSRAFAQSPVKLGLWNAAGFVYIALGAATLLVLRSDLFSIWTVPAVLLSVVATDVCAYFAGRTIGGPRIAPAISPNKTWAGLGGGMVGASLVVLAVFASHDPALRGSAASPATADWSELAAAVPIGIAIAVIAQAGDLFQSWMKRRAGVKDSGRLLPGHGGLFDRVDGLMAVLTVGGIAGLLARGAGWS